MTLCRGPAAEPLSCVFCPKTRLLRSALKAVSYGVPLRQVNEDAAWLELRGLVACENAEDMLIVRITRRGLDVVAGDETVDGVERSYMEM